MFCLTLFEGLLFLGKQKVVSSHFFHNWLLFVCLWQKCTCSLYGTVVRQFVLNEMGWSILRIFAGLDLNHARWHVSIRDNKLIHTSHNLCGSVPISGLNIIKTFLTKQDAVFIGSDCIDSYCNAMNALWISTLVITEWRMDGHHKL